MKQYPVRKINFFSIFRKCSKTCKKYKSWDVNHSERSSFSHRPSPSLLFLHCQCQWLQFIICFYDDINTTKWIGKVDIEPPRHWLQCKSWQKNCRRDLEVLGIDLGPKLYKACASSTTPHGRWISLSKWKYCLDRSNSVISVHFCTNTGELVCIFCIFWATVTHLQYPICKKY